MGAPAVLDLLAVDFDPIRIAIREFQAGSVPLTVQRFPRAGD